MALLSLLATQAYKQGEFRLASGKTTQHYVDCKQVITNSFGLRLTLDYIYSLYSSLHQEQVISECEFVAGGGLGGIILASAMSVPFGLDLLCIRDVAKDHGTGNLVEPGPFKISSGLIGGLHKPNVLLIEDVITTGQSVLKSTVALESQGYKVQGIIAIVDRQEGGIAAIEAAGYKVRALYSLDNIIYSYAKLCTRHF